MTNNTNSSGTPASNELFRAVADCTYDWESWLDPTGAVVWVNRAVERLTSFSVEECLGMEDYPLSIVAPDDRELMRSILRRSLDGESGNDREFRIHRKDGTAHWFAVSWQPLEDGDGHRIGVRMSMRDIRERKLMEEERTRYSLELEELAQARAANIVDLKRKKHRVEKLAALGVMAAKVAHEINNPMAGIKNAIRLVRDDRGLEPASSEMLRLVDKEIQRVIELLQQLYQLYKPNIAAPSTFDVVQVLNEVISWVETQTAPKTVRVERIDWPERFSVTLYDSEFRQIAHNLLLNAWETSEEGSKIELKISKTGTDRLRIVISDHGPGISQEVLERIFEPFVTTKQDEGRSNTGLGLAISQSLATAIGGTIEPIPTQGGGATFVLELPIDYTREV